MITCAITGSNGVLGKKLKSLLPFKFYEFKKDIRNLKNVEEWILKKDFDIIIHLAAIVATDKVNKNYKKAYDINVDGTLNLVNSIIKKKINPGGFFLHQLLMFINQHQNLKKLVKQIKQIHKINMEQLNLLLKNFLKSY